MRYKLLAALVVISCAVHGQQVNPVPDYVFQNRMSVGRTTVTDTLAYFSMGPRYGAIRGFMPPMVVDTALVTGGTKRNGLTIFSIQKNKYVYWDSVGSKWAEMAGTGGTAINSGDTASMLSPYTRGSGTTNYLPKFTGTRTFGNSVAYDNGTELLVNTTVDSGAYTMQVNGNIYTKSGLFVDGVREFEIGNNGENAYQIIDRQLNQRRFVIDSAGNIFMGGTLSSVQGNNAIASARNGEFYVNNNSTDAGSYALQVTGAIYNTTGAAFAASSGNVGIGTTSPSLENNSAIKELTVTKSGDATNLATLNLQGDRSSDGAVMSRIGSINFWQTTNNIARINGVRSTANNSGAIDFQTDNAGGGLTGRMRIQSNGEVNIDATGTYTDAGAYALQVAGSIYNTTGAVLAASSGNVLIANATASASTLITLGIGNSVGGAVSVQDTDDGAKLEMQVAGATSFIYNVTNHPMTFGVNNSEAARFNTSKELLLNTTTDAGAYILQVAGSIYNTTGAVFAASSGNVGVGVTSPVYKFEVSEDIKSGQRLIAQGNLTASSWVENSVTIGYSSTNGYGWVIAGGASDRTNLVLYNNVGIKNTSPAYALDVTGDIRATTTITSGAPTSGTAKPWRLGEAATVSPTSPNRTIRVEIDGTVYYIHAKTTND